MRQVPALFLPKGTYGKKTTVDALPTFILSKKRKTKIAEIGRAHV